MSLSPTKFEGCTNTIRHSLRLVEYECGQTVTTVGLFAVVSPLSWDVESDMELVLSDMTVSSARQQAFSSHIVTLYPSCVAYCGLSHRRTCVTATMNRPLAVRDISVRL